LLHLLKRVEFVKHFHLAFDYHLLIHLTGEYFLSIANHLALVIVAVIQFDQ